MRDALLRWSPAGLLILGSIFIVGIQTQRPMSLRSPLDQTIPKQIGEYVAHDSQLSEQQLRIAGVSDYLMRTYRAGPDSATGAWFSLYVGYYDQQSQGNTIHSPKNCLPGSGWEPLASRTVELPLSGESVAVNRYILQRDDERALVLYWYQGRGRVQANEYTVKFELLRDSALRGRSDEALVRVVVPIAESEEAAFDIAARAARAIVPSVYSALPS